MLGRLVQSTTVVLLALLVCGDIGWRLAERRYSNQVDEAALVKSIQKSVATRGVNPDVLVVGSSLSYCFTYDVDSREDVKFNKGGDPAGNHGNCADDPFLSNLIAQRGKPGKRVYVMALPGAMATDIANIVESAFAEGKHPSEVIYTAAPRDFVDNLAVTSYGAKTFSAKTEAGTDSGAEKPVSFAQQVQNRLALMVPPAVSRRVQRLATNPNCANLVELFVCSASTVYEQRSHLKDIVVNGVCDWLHRDKDLWSANHAVRKTEKSMTRFDRDLANYQTRYVPPNFDRLKREAPALKKLADLCSKHGAKLVLINMPLSAPNKKLLDAKLYGEYKSALAGAGSASTVEVLDSDKWSDQFPREVFLDSAHLNRAGSKRLQELVAPAVAEAVR